MRGIGYRFSTRDEFRRLLDASEDRELEVSCGAALREREWLVATFEVAHERLSVAARARDRGDGPRIAFEERDWERIATLTLPCDEGYCRESVAPRSSEFRVRPPQANRVLVVDGEPDVREMVCAVVRGSGFTSFAVGSAEDALDLLRMERFDLLVVEQDLRGMSGLELCLRLPQRARGTPALLLANHPIAARPLQSAAASVSDYLVKPFRAPELWARMLSLLELSGVELCAHAS